METIFNKKTRLSLDQNSLKIINYVIANIFILIFIYTASSKLLGFEKFQFVLGKSPLIGHYKTIIAWMIPIVEIMISFLLMISKTRKIGFIFSFMLMIVFTTYLSYMLSIGKPTCSCGGVIGALSWKNHIIFNIFLIIISAVGIKISAILDK